MWITCQESSSCFPEFMDSQGKTKAVRVTSCSPIHPSLYTGIIWNSPTPAGGKTHPCQKTFHRQASIICLQDCTWGRLKRVLGYDINSELSCLFILHSTVDEHGEQQGRTWLAQGNKRCLQEQGGRSEGGEGEASAEVLLKAGAPNSEFVLLTSLIHWIHRRRPLSPLLLWITRPKYVQQWCSGGQLWSFDLMS